MSDERKRRAATAAEPAAGDHVSRVIRAAGGAWPDVPVRPYKRASEHFRGVTRRLLAAPPEAGFEIRYFEVEPGGFTTLERHQHVHIVVCVRGRGRVRLGDESHDVGIADLVYVAPGTPHQFRCDTDEPFGFLCIVDRERDRPTPVTESAGDASTAGPAPGKVGPSQRRSE
jgi:quercetin dioxygenase-like cupin family protein